MVYPERLTSPKAPLPIIFRRSKSSTQSLFLINLVYSVSFLCKSSNNSSCSFSDTSKDAIFCSSTKRLQIKRTQFPLILWRNSYIFGSKTSHDLTKTLQLLKQHHSDNRRSYFVKFCNTPRFIILLGISTNR